MGLEVIGSMNFSLASLCHDLYDVAPNFPVLMLLMESSNLFASVALGKWCQISSIMFLQICGNKDINIDWCSGLFLPKGPKWSTNTLLKKTF